MGQTLEGWSKRLKPALDRRGQAQPRLWLLSDPVRLPDPAKAAQRLPRGAGVLLRGATLPVRLRLAKLARQRSLVVLVGGDGRAALALRAGLHVPDRAPCRHLLPFLLARRRGPSWARLCFAVHGRSGLARARRLGADLCLISPAFPTASHPGAPGLGPLRWAALARQLGRIPAIALGGVAPASAGRLPRRWTASFAAIGALGN